MEASSLYSRIGFQVGFQHVWPFYSQESKVQPETSPYSDHLQARSSRVCKCMERVRRESCCPKRALGSWLFLQLPKIPAEMAVHEHNHLSTEAFGECGGRQSTEPHSQISESQRWHLWLILRTCVMMASISELCISAVCFLQCITDS